MKGDFSRDSFNKLKHFRRVLMQQGRVQLDADRNEQVSILLHYIQTLAMDIIGPYAGPEGDWGFAIEGKVSAEAIDFTIGKGRYYVNGILCENDAPDGISYRDQPDPPELIMMENGKCYVVYLDVWERHITHIEDDDIREKALGGADTATRTKTVWQVKVEEPKPETELATFPDKAAILGDVMAISEAHLRVMAKRDPEAVETCPVDPEARYRGHENQLYRVEVHYGGCSLNSESSQPPTFKWSRENGAVVFPIKGEPSLGPDSITLELENLERDVRFGLAVNDWVEIEDDGYVLQNQAKSLFKVLEVDRDGMTVTLEKKPDCSYYLDRDFTKPAWLRRWDQKKKVDGHGVIEITESEEDEDSETDWHELEDGIKIQFKPGGTYRTGDYWLIPARTVLNDVEWLQNDLSKPEFLPPIGVKHHFAPLAIISVEDGKVTVEEGNDCRCKIKPLFDCPNRE